MKSTKKQDRLFGYPVYLVTVYYGRNKKDIFIFKSFLAAVRLENTLDSCDIDITRRYLSADMYQRQKFDDRNFI